MDRPTLLFFGPHAEIRLWTSGSAIYITSADNNLEKLSNADQILKMKSSILSVRNYRPIYSYISVFNEEQQFDYWNFANLMELDFELEFSIRK